MTTVLEFAKANLATKQIKATTMKNYLKTIHLLQLEDMPMESININFLHGRLQTIMNPGTRNRHAIALRSALNVPLKVTSTAGRVYDLSTLSETHEVLKDTKYRTYAFCMLYAGMRIGETLVKQPYRKNVITIDRQINDQNELSTAKSTGQVVIPDWFVDEYDQFSPYMKRSALYQGLKRLSVKTGVTCTPHALRHMFATELVRNGCGPELLKRQMRHHDVSVSLKYYVQHTQSDYEQVVARAFNGS